MSKDINKSARIKLLISRIVVYGILIFLAFLCLFFFYLMIINSSRSNAQLNTGFTIIPGGHFIENLKNAWHDGDINIPVGMKNSFIVASLSAILTSYFSALTAYGTYVYDFRFKKAIHLFILAIMMIAMVGAAFADGEVVEVAGRDDFGYVTPVMKEKDFAAKYEALGDKVITRIRIEA